MPGPSPSSKQVPDEAFQAFCRELTSRRCWTIANDEAAEDIEAALEATYPLLVEDLKRRALSGQAVEAALNAAIRHPDVDVAPGGEPNYRDLWRPIIRNEIEAVFDALPDTPDQEKPESYDEKPPIWEVWRCLWSSMGALDAICDELPEGPTGGRLRGYIEHGLPEMLPFAERALRAVGIEPDQAVADKSFARGVQSMVLLRREEESGGEIDREAWKQPPEEFLAEYCAKQNSEQPDTPELEGERRALTIDCGEGRHAACSGSGDSVHLIPQEAGRRFTCSCSCHQPEPNQVEEEGDWPEISDEAYEAATRAAHDWLGRIFAESTFAQTDYDDLAAEARPYSLVREVVQQLRVSCAVPTDSSPIEEGGDGDKRLEAAQVVEHGKGPEVEAARVLRRFMCCQAGRDLVEYGLLRPFGLTSQPLPAAVPSTPQRSVLEEVAEELKERAEKADARAAEGRFIEMNEGSADAYRAAAAYVREKAAQLPSEGREDRTAEIAKLLVERDANRGDALANLDALELHRKARGEAQAKAQRYEEALKAADDFAATALKQDTAQEWHTDVRSLREVIAAALQDGGEGRG